MACLMRCHEIARTFVYRTPLMPSHPHRRRKRPRARRRCARGVGDRGRMRRRWRACSHAAIPRPALALAVFAAVFALRRLSHRPRVRARVADRARHALRGRSRCGRRSRSARRARGARRSHSRAASRRAFAALASSACARRWRVRAAAAGPRAAPQESACEVTWREAGRDLSVVVPALEVRARRRARAGRLQPAVRRAADHDVGGA